MFINWIKKIIPCKYCGSDNYYSKFSDKKIKRYGIHCTECNRHLGWPPDIYKNECKEIEKKEPKLF